MESFFTFLSRRVADTSSLLCIGLDPHLPDLEAFPGSRAEAAREFCLRLVRSTARWAAAFKPNAAFFEVLGPEGWQVLADVVQAIKAESERQGSLIPVILDGKRGDIASTAQAYADSAFAGIGAQAVTLNPYLGFDSLQPFIEDREKGVFLLCKTSNPGSGDLQDLPVYLGAGENDEARLEPLYLQVARLARKWNAAGNIGLVVGATYPEILARVRAAVEDLWFLVPGIGAQGGDLEAALKAGLRPGGDGMLINVSRGVARATDPGRAAAELRDRILEIQGSLSGG